MTYQVTQRDINLGIRRNPNLCPVARAIARRHQAGNIAITNRYAIIGAADYDLPARVANWVSDFDNELPVRPMRFELL